MASNSPSPLKVNLTNQVLTPVKKTSILEQTLKAPHVGSPSAQPLTNKENEEDKKSTNASMCKDIMNAVLTAESAEDESKQNVYIPVKDSDKTAPKQEVKEEIKQEVKKEEYTNSELKDEPMEIDVTCTPPVKKKPKMEDDDSENVDMKDMSPESKK